MIAEESSAQWKKSDNLDPATVAGFGDEWSRFSQDLLDGNVRDRL